MAKKDYLPVVTEIVTATIASGAALSDAVDTKGYRVIGVATPSAITSTTVTFQGSDDNSSFYAIQDASAAISITVAVDELVLLSPQVVEGVRYIKLAVDTAEAAARSIKVVLKLN
jgi:hypothetical protein